MERLVVDGRMDDELGQDAVGTAVPCEAAVHQGVDHRQRHPSGLADAERAQDLRPARQRPQPPAGPGHQHQRALPADRERLPVSGTERGRLAALGQSRDDPPQRQRLVDVLVAVDEVERQAQRLVAVDLGLDLAGERMAQARTPQERSHQRQGLSSSHPSGATGVPWSAASTGLSWVKTACSPVATPVARRQSRVSRTAPRGTMMATAEMRPAAASSSIAAFTHAAMPAHRRGVGAALGAAGLME